MYVCMYVCLPACLPACMYVCMYVCMTRVEDDYYQWICQCALKWMVFGYMWLLSDVALASGATVRYDAVDVVTWFATVPAVQIYIYIDR